MRNNSLVTQFLFVIDTDKYAGNFERQMCGYVTGQVGECGVGMKEAETARKQIPNIVTKLEEIVTNVPDDHGCNRPVSIFSTPGWFNHGMGGHFREGSETQALLDYRREMQKYYRDQIKLTRSVIVGTGGWTAKGKKESIAKYQSKIDEAMALTKVHKYPAYNSVAIYFNKVPDKELIDAMKKRAYKFASKKRIKIKKFRLLKEQSKSYREI